MPEISMIVPVYNVEQYLPAALDSLRAQTCPDWEAILVDDGSPDGCGALCDAAARQDARFRVIHQKNAGVGAARNAGLAAARGTYVQFLDSDDALEPQMVEVLCRTARQTDADLIMFGGYEEHYAADGTRTGCTDIAPVLEGVYRGDPCPQLFPQLSAMSLVTRQLFRRRCIEEGRCRFTDYKIAEDALFFVSFYRQHLHCVVGIPEKLYRYKLRVSGSASQSYHPERLADNFYLSDAVEAVAKDWGLNDDPACRRAVNHSRVLDLQLGIKNVCLGPLSFRQRTRMAAAGVAHPGGTSRCAGHAPAGRPQPQRLHQTGLAEGAAVRGGHCPVQLEQPPLKRRNNKAPLCTGWVPCTGALYFIREKRGLNRRRCPA
ncbi:MAG: glycosyltransferase family 2 protein [Faecalibacterium sp.]